MDWLRENWFWLILIGLFIWMHTKMHGHHGGGGHGGGRGAGCGGHAHGGDRDSPPEQKEGQHAEH